MPSISSLDRLKAQLQTTGLQQKNFQLYQIISQLIDFLRQGIDLTTTGLAGVSSSVSAATPSPITQIILGTPFPIDGDEGEIGFPGIGTKGLDGVIGVNGLPGIQFIPLDGENGIDGDPGFPGGQGIPGTNGIIGVNGLPGIQFIPLDGEEGLEGQIGIGIPGRTIQVYEQALEPVGALPGDFWITP